MSIRQAATFLLLSLCSCLLFLRRRQAATFSLSNLVTFFWFETQLSSTFQGVKTLAPYSLQWDNIRDTIDIRLTLADPYGIVSVLLFGVYERTSGKTNSWSETLCCLATTHFIHDVYDGIFKWSDKKNKWAELRVVFSQHDRVATPRNHTNIAGFCLGDVWEPGLSYNCQADILSYLVMNMCIIFDYE